MFRSQQRGFTLIELVVVIVILGILAAFAVPKFMGLETQARIASLNAMAGTLRSSAAMARGVWMAQGGTATSITVDGVAITMTNGYPARAQLSSLVQDMAGFTYNAANGQFTPNGARNAANCWLQYTQAPANGTYTITYAGGANSATTLSNNC